MRQHLGRLCFGQQHVWAIGEQLLTTSINSTANMAIIENGNEILAANNINQQHSVAINSADMGATARNSQRYKQNSETWIAPGAMNGNGVQAN